MLELFILIICLMISTTFYSMNDYHVFKKSYSKLNFMFFTKRGRILIANENSNEEFVILSSWNFNVAPNYFLQFDIWTLVDLHKLYWIIKFHNKIKSLGHFKTID